MTINKKTVALFALDVASVVFGNFATKMAIVVVKNILKNVKEFAQGAGRPAEPAACEGVHLYSWSQLEPVTKL